jgi:hypothetical protein
VPTVWELSAPYENYLVPVLPVSPGVCAVCHTSVAAAGTLCYQCSRAGSSLAATASAVGYTALAVKGEQLARDLWVYKNGPSENIRWAPRLGLAAVLWRSLALHERCLAAAAKVPGFSVVTTVPSTSGRADEPIAALAQMIGATHDRYQRLLWSNPQVPNTRDPRGDRYSALRSLVGESVLLLDDTWTSGAHAQSAAAALRAAGANAVGIWAIGRHFNREQPGEYGEAAQGYYRQARALGWSWERCCLCDDRSQGSG